MASPTRAADDPIDDIIDWLSCCLTPCASIHHSGVKNIQVPKHLKPSKKEISRLQEMQKKGSLKRLKGGKLRDRKLNGATLILTCKINDLLDKYEEGVKPETLSKICYKQAK